MLLSSLFSNPSYLNRLWVLFSMITMPPIFLKSHLWNWLGEVFFACFNKPSLICLSHLSTFEKRKNKTVTTLLHFWPQLIFVAFAEKCLKMKSYNFSPTASSHKAQTPRNFRASRHFFSGAGSKSRPFHKKKVLFFNSRNGHLKPVLRELIKVVVFVPCTFLGRRNITATSSHPTKAHTHLVLKALPPPSQGDEDEKSSYAKTIYNRIEDALAGKSFPGPRSPFKSLFRNVHLANENLLYYFK